MGRVVLSRCCSAALTLSAMTLGGGGAWAQSATTPLSNWITGLPTSQYTVTQGTVSNFTCPIDGSPNPYISDLGSCFGNNSATPYVVIAPPPSSTGTNGAAVLYPE